MTYQAKFGSFFDMAKSTASMAGDRAGTLFKAGQAQWEQQLQARQAASTSGPKNGRSESESSGPFESTTSQDSSHPSNGNSEQQPPQMPRTMSNYMMQLDSKLVFDLPAECDKAAKILGGFMYTHPPDTEAGKRILNVIPNEVVRRAKGFAVFTVLKGKFIKHDLIAMAS